ncbi:MAG TPA: DUF4395 family protein [Acidobacteriota bacterium]|nr:DUF4395 family protein [Acidobacteriota bacterium]
MIDQAAAGLSDRQKRNFILQQGFSEPAGQTCEMQFSALQFQPRILLVLVVIAILLQSPMMFFTLGVILLWNSLLPRWNVFELIYNATLGSRPGAMKAEPAPAPRRFSQFLAAMIMTGAGLGLMMNWKLTTYVCEGFILLAVSLLVFAKLCLGSFIFYVITRKSEFAKRTLPWSK